MEGQPNKDRYRVVLDGDSLWYVHDTVTGDEVLLPHSPVIEAILDDEDEPQDLSSPLPTDYYEEARKQYANEVAQILNTADREGNWPNARCCSAAREVLSNFHEWCGAGLLMAFHNYTESYNEKFTFQEVQYTIFPHVTELAMVHWQQLWASTWGVTERDVPLAITAQRTEVAGKHGSRRVQHLIFMDKKRMEPSSSFKGVV